MNLTHYFGEDWDIPSHVINGQNYYPGVKVRGRLGLRNSTNAIRGKVSRENRAKVRVESINHRRAIHMITLAGVIELIIHSSTPEARRIKSYLINRIITQHAGEIDMRN